MTLRTLLAGCFLLTSHVHAQLACNAIDFLRAPEIATYAAGGEALVGAMLRQSDGSFSLQQYETFSPYRKRDAIPQFDDRFYNCLPQSLKPRLPITTNPRLGQLRLGIASAEYELVDLSGQGQLAAIGVYTRIAQDSIVVGQANPDLSLKSTATYPVAKDPSAFVTADFNGDNRRDIAVLSYGADFNTGGTLSVLLGNTDGTFRSVAPLALGVDVQGVTAADFNGDQRIDLAVVSSNRRLVFILLGNGDGTFRAPATIPISAWSSRIVAADVNGDNRLDLVMPADTGSAKSILTLLGNGDGTFRTPPISSAAGSQGSGIATGDFNKDGRIDVAIVSSQTSIISVLLGDGTGRFTARSRYLGGYSPNSLRITDFNLDGNPDLIVGTGEPDAVTHSDNSGTISVLFGRGDGTFHGAPAYIVGDSPKNIVTADFNGDGIPDFATPSTFDGRLAIALGLGDGQFREPEFIRVTTPNGSQSLLAALTAGDFNRDGRIDLAGAGSTGVFIWNGNGNGTFQTPTVIDMGAEQSWIASGDLNGDGRPDFAVTTLARNVTPGSGAVSVILSNATGFQAPVRIRSVTAPRQVHIQDINGDQRPDLLVVDNGTYDGSEPGGLLVFQNNGNGTFQNPTTLPIGRNPTHMRSADLNGDSRPDLVVSTREGEFGFRYGILLARAGGGFEPVRMANTDFGPADIAIADFTGDRKPDLAIAHCCGDTVLELLIGNGDGTFGPPSEFVMESSWLLAGDLNRDGRDDLMVVGGSGAVAVLINANRNAGVLSAVSAASVKLGPIAPDSLVSAFGGNMASELRSAESIPLPTNINGTTVVVRDRNGAERLAGLTFVSPGQVNFLVPTGTAVGDAAITISSPGNVSVGRAEIASITPGIFQLNQTGLAAATLLRVPANGERSVEPVFGISDGAVVPLDIDLGPEGDQLFLTLFGTGFRRGTIRNTTVRIGGVETPPLFIGAQPDYPGLDQLNVQIPRALAGRGPVDVEVTVAGTGANTVNLTIK